MTPFEFNEASRGHAEVARDQIELAKDMGEAPLCFRDTWLWSFW